MTETQVRQKCEMREHCIAFDQRFNFRYDLDTMLRQPASELRVWQELSTEWIQESIKQRQNEAIRKTRRIELYFARR
jgi:hypothetical protein